MSLLRQIRLHLNATTKLAGMFLVAASSLAIAYDFVTPVCYLPGGCANLSPGSPTSVEKVDVSITVYSGIPPDACIRTLSNSVIGDVISISGAYVHCYDVYFPEPPPTHVNTLLEPLAAGHYTVNFTTYPDPSYGSIGWVYGPNGWVQAGVLISAPVDVAPAASAVPNYEGLWWAAPPGSESGWGINFAYQGNVIFATWFTYDATGKPWWLSMTATQGAPNSFAGTLYRTTGPAFDAAPFNPTAVVATPVGMGTLTFSDANHGSFAYSVNGDTQTKAITRQVFGTLPNCTFGVESDLSLASNYQDLWWAAPAGIESGWGINLTEQSNIIFATWFTYDHDGTPLWLSATAINSAPGVYTGDLYRTAGPAFNAVPFNPSAVVATKVGTATFSFLNGNSASFAYTVNGETQSKMLVREVFRTPGTVCQ